MVHVYYGDGPGKTTAAVGLAVRARGHGIPVLFAQFLKNGRSGELGPLRAIGVEMVECEPCGKFIPFMDERDKARTAENQRNAFQRAKEKASGGAYGLLVMDEALDLAALGIVSPADLLDFLRAKPESLEIMLTGHKVFPELLELADYVTEMKKVRHPYDGGAKARKGVEW
jgi:cob(I)alamin adenosyltransferase